jgi:hypothetical protein
MNQELQTPVVFMVFNRPATTRAVFRAIAAAQPRTLLIVADGPRRSRPGDEELCEEVRAIVSQVDWPCQVLTNFADSNLGCEERVVSGITWAFSQVGEAIILEDDCLPHETFFPFCQELLERYRGDSRIGMISGNNHVAPRFTTPYSYYFSRLPHIWGWATWRSAWQRYDRSLSHWPAIKRDDVLREILSNEAEVKDRTTGFDSFHAGRGLDTWDAQWLYTVLINSMLSIVPSVNMVRNIGFGPDATHTLRDPSAKMSALLANPMDSPLRHPPYVVPFRSFDALDYQIGTSSTFGERIQAKLHSLRRHLGLGSGSEEGETNPKIGGELPGEVLK